MQAKRRKGVLLDVSRLNAKTPVRRADAVLFIATKIAPIRADSLTPRKSFVGKRINAAVERGDLTEQSAGGFIFGDITRWANEVRDWNGLFKDLPMTPREVIHATTNLTLSGYTIKGAGTVIPTDLRACQTLCSELYTTIANLQQKLDAACADLERIRPDAESWRQHIKHLKDIAKKPRSRSR